MFALHSAQSCSNSDIRVVQESTASTHEPSGTQFPLKKEMVRLVEPCVALYCKRIANILLCVVTVQREKSICYWSFICRFIVTLHMYNWFKATPLVQTRR